MFRQVLEGYGLSTKDASCVARHAFAAEPVTSDHADGWYSITRAMLVAAGADCAVNWADYDFSRD